jgi:hypothetical protein
MKTTAKRSPQLTEYERAVCYYTLPKVINPITYGIIVAYTVCLVEAMLAWGVGELIDSRIWTRAGMFSFVGIVVLGIAVFTARALTNEIRQRKALAAAGSVIQKADPEEDIPDPFREHLLFRYPMDGKGEVYLCNEDNETLRYCIQKKSGKKEFHIISPEQKEVCRVENLGGFGSFLFDAWTGCLKVYVGGDQVAKLDRRFSFTVPEVVINELSPEERQLNVSRQGIFYEHCLVGRMYTLRHAAYLDINKYYISEAILAYFAASMYG